MKLKLIEPPTTPPIELAKIKKFLRVLGNDQDEVIDIMLKSAIQRAEDITNLQLGGVATFALYLDDWQPVVELPKPPFVSIEQILYIDTNGAEQELEANEWDWDDKDTIAKVRFFRPYNKIGKDINAIAIKYKAGYSSLPPAIESYIKVQISTMYEHREKFVIGASVTEFGSRYIDNLLDSYRIVPI